VDRRESRGGRGRYARSLCEGRDMDKPVHPTRDEVEFLTLSFNRFLDLFQEIMTDEFWGKADYVRFSKTRDLFVVYCEILKYPPMQWAIEANKRPSHSNVGKDLFRFVRHILIHFPFFERWDDVWIKQSLVNLYSSRPQFIHKFLTEHEGKEQLKYRYWEEKPKRMTYISVSLPNDYTTGKKVFLRDIITEKEGVKFCAIFMWNIMKIQVEEIKDEGHTVRR